MSKPGHSRGLRHHGSAGIMAHKKKLFLWREAIASDKGPNSSTRRAILNKLSDYMGNDTCHCFPSINALAKATLFKEKTVITHLQLAVKEGWIKRKLRGKAAGQAWAGYEYWGTFPPGLKQKGTERRSAPRPKGTEPHAGGAEPDGEKVLNEVQPNSSNSLNNSTAGRVSNPAPPGALEGLRYALGKEARK